MKRSLLALAALTAFAGAASAQSSVTLFGIVDATLAIGRGSLADRTQLTNSGYNSARLGFRGNEDMGGGLWGGFWLEAGLTNDDGTGAQIGNNNNQAIGAFNPATGANAAAVRPGTQGLTFNRRSTVSMGGGFGEIRLGREYTPQFWNHTVYDPFGTNGVGTSQLLNSSIGGPTTVRASNSISYLFGHAFNATSTGGQGLHLFAMYYLGENFSNAANKKDGTGAGLRVGYGAGGLSAAVAVSKTNYLTGNISTMNVGAAYAFGPVSIKGIYDRDKVSGGATGKGYLLGVNAAVGVGEVRASWSTYKVDNTAATALDPKINKLAVGYVHNLSKRTAVYTTFARLTNKSGAGQALNGATTAVGNNSTGFDFGLRHVF